jgi:hypothetical protein
MYYNKNNVTIDVTEIKNGKVVTEKYEQVITAETKLIVTHNNNKYYVNCYYTGDYEEGSDSYVIRVYNSTDGMDITNINWLNKHEISWSDVDSSGNCYDNGLRLEDNKVEEAIMEVLFAGDKPIIVAF